MSAWKDYQKPNIGLLFYKNIYKEKAITDTLIIDDKNNKYELVFKVSEKKDESPFDQFYIELLKTKAGDLEQIENPAYNHSFVLYTTYPGLLIGSGYQHDTKAVGDFKIGFFFDHTTGQAVIPGSSVKGILRSLFESDIPKEGHAYTGQKSVKAIKFICDEIIESFADNEPEIKKWKELKGKVTVEKLNDLKIQIFGDGEPDRIMGIDIFFDSVINIDKTNSESRIFSTDFITPHDNPLKNPVPIQFLKVLPNIAFDFKFILHDAGDWTKEIKETLFKQILLTLGAGAKTNVGYGQFTSNPPRPVVKKQGNKKADAVHPQIAQTSILEELTQPSLEASELLIKDSVWPALVIRIKKDNCLIKILINDEPVVVKKKLKNIPFGVKENDMVTVVFISNYSCNKDPEFRVIQTS